MGQYPQKVMKMLIQTHLMNIENLRNPLDNWNAAYKSQFSNLLRLKKFMLYKNPCLNNQHYYVKIMKKRTTA